MHILFFSHYFFIVVYNPAIDAMANRPFYRVSNKTGPLQLILHNFTKSQLSPIIFGTG